MIKIKSKSLFKKIANARSIFIFILTLSIIFAYKSEFVAFKGIDKLEEMTQGELGLKSIRRNIMKVFDELSIPNNFSAYYDTPIMDISVTKKAINAISIPINNALEYRDVYYKSQYMLPIHGNKYTKKSKINVTYGGEEYKAKIKIQGRSEEHFLNRKKSYAIKFSKQKLLNNMREVALIILDEQDITSVFSYYLVKRYLGIDVNSSLVRLRINGVDQGLYFMEEKVRKELLEKNNLSGVDIVQPNAMWTTQTSTTHVHQFDNNIAGVNLKNYSNIDNGQLLRYKKLYSVEDYSDLSKLVDIDSFARFEAIRMLHADRHSATGDNLKLFYNHSTGRFSPFYRSESVVGDLEKYSNSDLYIYDKLAFKVDIFEILVKNNSFRSLRNKYLFDIVSNKIEILEYYKSILDKYIDAVDEDVSNLLSQREYIYVAKSNYKLIEKNIETIRKYLEYGRVYTLLLTKNPREYVLEIDADSNSFVKIEDISFFKEKYPDIFVSVEDYSNSHKVLIKSSELSGYFKRQRYILGLDDNFESEDNQRKYHLVFDKDVNVDNFKIEYLNAVTGKRIKKVDNYVKELTKPKYFSFEYLGKNLHKFLEENEGFSYDGESIKFTKEKYEIHSNLIFPYGYDVSIPSGVTLELAHNVSVLIYGGVDIEGDDRNPVTIKNLTPDKPFGAIIVLGDKSTQVNINKLDLSGGSESKVNGVFGSGSISLYNHKSVKVVNSHIHHNFSDDGMNIKNSKFEIVDSKFINNFADQVDIDFSEGVVKGSIFKLDKSEYQHNLEVLSDNGDGLDLSGSRILVVKNIFEGFLDKALSVGENTKVLVSDNVFRGNRSAITAKDQSDVFIHSNRYEDNKLNIETYQKKKIFNHPNVFILNEEHNTNSIRAESLNLFTSSPIIDNIETDGVGIFQWLSFQNWIEYPYSN